MTRHHTLPLAQTSWLKLATVFFIIWGLLLASPLLAQTPEDELAGWNAAADDQLTEGDFKASVGIGVGYVPEFEGSDDYEIALLPILDLRYDRFFLSTAQGLGFNIIQTPQWTVAPTINYARGRDESDNYRLAGLGDVSGGLTAGGLVSFHPGQFAFIADLDVGLGGAEGSLVGLAAFYSIPVSPEFSAKLGLSTQYATSDYNRANFGINAIQSARSGYPVYDPKSGIKHIAFSGTVNYNITEKIKLGFFGEYRVLTGPADDSPLVRAGSEDQIRTGLTIGYQIK
ncbi:MAG: MipA/OmpV family protein [Deltaproteobacteria bacterium]|jgi:outer membrane protein|nr:MipA/OmpV family protein [Deltaproteobacteria bacterium]